MSTAEGQVTAENLGQIKKANGYKYARPFDFRVKGLPCDGNMQIMKQVAKDEVLCNRKAVSCTCVDKEGMLHVYLDYHKVRGGNADEVTAACLAEEAFKRVRPQGQAAQPVSAM